MRHIYKNTLFCSLFFLSFISVVFLFYSESEAKVRGMCANCHTMHNSQDGASMVLDTIDSAGADLDCTGCHSEPRENLLRLDCIGCHAMDLAGPSTQPLDGYPVPQVYYAEVANKSMAAGNFYYVSLDDAHGHNIHGFYPLIQQEFVMPSPNIPPGYVEQMDPSSVKFNTWAANSVPSQILCSGAFGCHGNRNEKSQTKSMQGSHHAEDEPVLQLGTKGAGTVGQGTSIGTSYRFLSGVLGGEASDWEWGATSSDHNEYFGKELDANPRPTLPVTGVASMSEFCASCHGNFHQYNPGVADSGITAQALIDPLTAGAMSPWIRHPTDILLPPDGEFSAYVSYNLTAPVARTTIPASASPAGRVPAEPIVFCLSCHRGHASRYWDSLRFSYGEMTTGNAGAGAGEGCFACHSDKDGI
jgi:hypothetical protein